MKMNKTKTRAFGKDTYLLGRGTDGRHYWLEQATWDCDWYWGGGYVETYTNDLVPSCSKDIASHSHFDSMFFNKKKNGYDNFKDFFEETPFTDSEIWKICELMKSFYIAREYADMVHRGGAHYTTNPAKDIIKNDEHYNHVNKTVIPAIMEELYKVLSEQEVE